MKKDILGKMLLVLLPTYRSIDLRVALVKTEDGRWKNVCSTIRFSYLSPDKLENYQAKVQSQRGRCITPRFKISFESLDVKKWEDLLSKVETGEYTIGGNLVIARPCNKIVDTRAIDAHHYLKNEDNWRHLECYLTPTGERKEVMGLVGEVLGDIRMETDYENAFVAVSKLLAVNYSRRTDLECVIGLPVYVALKDLLFENDTIHCTMESHRGFSDLKLDIVLLKGRDWEPEPKKGFLIDSLPHGTSGLDFVETDISHQVRSVDFEDHIGFRLYSVKLPEVYLIDERNRIRSMIEPQELQTPLPKALFRFCSESIIERMLLTPKEFATKPSRQSRIFERVVSWLFSLYGWPNIWLKEYEPLKSQKTGAPLGSADIIASPNVRERILVVIDGTTGVPSEPKIQRIRNTTDRLEKELFRDKGVILKAAIFTPEKAESLNEWAEDMGVSILDGPVLKRLLEGLAMSDYDQLARELRI